LAAAQEVVESAAADAPGLADFQSGQASLPAPAVDGDRPHAQIGGHLVHAQQLVGRPGALHRVVSAFPPAHTRHTHTLYNCGLFDDNSVLLWSLCCTMEQVLHCTPYSVAGLYDRAMTERSARILIISPSSSPHQRSSAHHAVVISAPYAGDVSP